ncbi:Nitro_FeMo-Co domain-containing protein [Thermococcus nautili]|uniref:NifB/NifX family molybdenum-iron cluster-binding protein n=1 Tax=Thermococcus nautili TaxID=195522 RepID=UPI0027A16AB3|nr:Nitro_FeMo-Co domain-containing protein [Thermococcus nautili]
MNLRIAVPLEGDDFESEVSEHFGRARHFAIVDAEDGEIRDVRIVELPFEEHGPGDIPNFLRGQGVEVVLAYGIGRKAIAHFEALGVRVIPGIGGKARKAVEAFLRGTAESDPQWRARISEGREHKT